MNAQELISLQNKILEIVEYFDGLCIENNITYLMENNITNQFNFILTKGLTSGSLRWV